MAKKARIYESLDNLKHWVQKSGLTLTFEHVIWKSIGIIYLLGATPAPSLVSTKWRERRTNWTRKSGLTLTFERVTWKSIGIIYSLRATPAPSLVLIKKSGQKILSGQHLVYRPTDRPTDSCKTIKMMSSVTWIVGKLT